MWDVRGFRVYGGIMVELRKTRGKKDMIADRNPDLGFTAYNSIHGIKINTKANSFIN